MKNNVIPTATIELVTPEMARKYLSKNNNNYRKLQKTLVKKYASDMAAGLWTLTTGGIGFDVNDQLTNGQHRLSAVVESEVACYFVIVRGLPDGAAQDPNEDTGSRRSVATHLHNSGFKNAHNLAATARLLLRIRSGDDSVVQTGHRPMSDAVIAKAVSGTPKIVEAVQATYSCKKVATYSVASAWYFIASCDDAELASYCVGVLAGETESNTTHPFVKLRDVLLSARANKATRGGMEVDMQLKFFLSAWEKARSNESVKLLRPAAKLRISSAAAQAIEGIEV